MNKIKMLALVALAALPLAAHALENTMPPLPADKDRFGAFDLHINEARSLDGVDIHQVVAPAVPSNTFFSTLITWTTSFDTSNTMFQPSGVIELYSGFVNNNNQNIEAEFGLRVNPSTNYGVAFGGTIYNNSVLGQVAGAEGWVGYGFAHYDFRLTPGLAVGYHADPLGVKRGRAYPFLRAEKAMSETTAAFIELGMPVAFVGQQNLVPDVTAGVTIKAWH